MSDSLWQKLKDLGRSRDAEKCDADKEHHHHHHDKDRGAFCPDCGARIAPHEAYCPDCHATLKPW